MTNKGKTIDKLMKGPVSNDRRAVVDKAGKGKKGPKTAGAVRHGVKVKPTIGGSTGGLPPRLDTELMGLLDEAQRQRAEADGYGRKKSLGVEYQPPKPMSACPPPVWGGVVLNPVAPVVTPQQVLELPVTPTPAPAKHQMTNAEFVVFGTADDEPTIEQEAYDLGGWSEPDRVPEIITSPAHLSKVMTGRVLAHNQAEMVRGIEEKRREAGLKESNFLLTGEVPSGGVEPEFETQEEFEAGLADIGMDAGLEAFKPINPGARVVESARVLTVFSLYYKQGPERSAARVARQLRIYVEQGMLSPAYLLDQTAIETWIKKFGWVQRCREFEQKILDKLAEHESVEILLASQVFHRMCVNQVFRLDEFMHRNPGFLIATNVKEFKTLAETMVLLRSLEMNSSGALGGNRAKPQDEASNMRAQLMAKVVGTADTPMDQTRMIKGLRDQVVQMVKAGNDDGLAEMQHELEEMGLDKTPAEAMDAELNRIEALTPEELEQEVAGIVNAGLVDEVNAADRGVTGLEGVMEEHRKDKDKMTREEMKAEIERLRAEMEKAESPEVVKVEKVKKARGRG